MVEIAEIEDTPTESPAPSGTPAAGAAAAAAGPSSPAAAAADAPRAPSAAAAPAAAASEQTAMPPPPAADDAAPVVHFPPEEEAELLAESDRLKQTGNALFGDQRYVDAVEKYEAALATCPRYLSKPVAVLWSNIAACHIKLENWAEAVEACTKAIAQDPLYVRPVVRRAQANEKLDTWTSLQAALDDYKKAQELSPSAEVARAMAALQPRIAAAQQRETAEVVGKLKDLGNGLLRPFGLSTDMFKMTPDGKGGYSMQFSKN
ncbi:TPR-like protein [Dipodascopsis tothii]|uniref:TPR-like protein n=1 Tax=Dipodascopsis tothii TaxID=44089 RepID=UPI0034CF3519